VACIETHTGVKIIPQPLDKYIPNPYAINMRNPNKKRNSMKFYLPILALMLSCEEYPVDRTDLEIFEEEHCILNGDLIEEVPYNNAIVGIGSREDGVALGTGILISSRIVLTAGHCGRGPSFIMKNGDTTKFDVFIGPDSKNPIEIIPVIGKDRYLYGEIDLGVWILKYKPEHAQPHKKFSTINESDYVSVYGFGFEKQLKYGGPLRKAMGYVERITAMSTIYYRVACGSETEGGDSGGPLFDIEGNLVAIHTGTFQVDKTSSRAVLIYPHIDWVESMLRLYENTP